MKLNKYDLQIISHVSSYTGPTKALKAFFHDVSESTIYYRCNRPPQQPLEPQRPIYQPEEYIRLALIFSLVARSSITNNNLLTSSQATERDAETITFTSPQKGNEPKTSLVVSAADIAVASSLFVSTPISNGLPDVSVVANAMVNKLVYKKAIPSKLFSHTLTRALIKEGKLYNMHDTFIRYQVPPKYLGNIPLQVDSVPGGQPILDFLATLVAKDQIVQRSPRHEDKNHNLHHQADSLHNEVQYA